MQCSQPWVADSCRQYALTPWPHRFYFTTTCLTQAETLRPPCHWWAWPWPIQHTANVYMWGRYIMQKNSDKGAVPASQSVFLWNRGVNTCGYLTDVLGNCHSFGIWDSRRRPDCNSVKLFTATTHCEYSVSFWHQCCDTDTRTGPIF